MATHNLSHSDNTLKFDTYGYEVGLHSIYIEYTASLIYDLILKTGQTNCHLYATSQSVLKIVD
ncbi:MAG: hypothetical protein IJJ11_05055 [Methanosphaera sp.]|nr:hypothetical protein [Methanosphaera sp.]